MRDFLLILGMHRSGTSAVAGACALAGARLGDDLIAPQDDNARGYFESATVLELHRRHLHEVGSSWDDIVPGRATTMTPALRDGIGAFVAAAGDHPLPAVKDPRLCRLLPHWLAELDRLGRRPCLLYVLRRPAEVAASLARRDGFSAEKAGLLWADHLVEAERAGRGRRRTFVRYRELLDDPVRTLDSAGASLGIEWPRPPASVADRLREFVDPGLRHWKDEPAGLDWGRAAEPIEILRPALDAAAATGDPDPVRFDAARGTLAESFSDVDPLVVSHVLEVGRREMVADGWLTRQQLSQEIARTAAPLAQRVEDVADRLEAATRRVEEVAQRVEALADDVAGAARTAGAVGEELDRFAHEAARRNASVDEGLAHLAKEHRDGEAVAERLAARLERLERPWWRRLAGLLKRSG